MPHINILEQSIIGKRGPDRCEDAVVVTDDFVCVIDGSTSKSQLPPLSNGLTGGQMAAQIVSETVRAMRADISIEMFVQLANTRFQQRYSEVYDAETLVRLRSHKEDRWTCSLILYSRHANSIWMIGDCQGVLMDSEGGLVELNNDKPYEAVLAQRRADYLKGQLALGRLTVEEVRRHDPGRDLILPEIVREMKNQNVTYAVLDGFDIAWHNVKVFSDIKAREVILASDGYLRLFPTLGASEQYLHQCLLDDPLMIVHHPATKCLMQGADSFDDRTYIRFQLSK